VCCAVSCESIPEPVVEQEEEALQDSTQFIKKKQPSKRVKSKSGKTDTHTHTHTHTHTLLLVCFSWSSAQAFI